jgi:hypothetical protein
MSGGRRAGALAVLVGAVALLPAACSAVPGAASDAASVGAAPTPAPTAAQVTDGTVPGPTAAPTAYEICAEFPVPDGPLPGDVEAWWNATPAFADGSINQDPATWPSQMREHPRVAVVWTGTGEVVSTWDRVACREGVPFEPTRTDAWPSELEADLVAVDMDTGEVLSSWFRTP